MCTKPWTLKIFRECLLSYDQPQQISKHVRLPENHKLIDHLCLRHSFSHAWLLFFPTTHVPEIFLVFVWVCGLSVNRSKQGLIYLTCYETLTFAKKHVHIYIGGETIVLLFYLAFWNVFVYFISYISAHFIEPLVSGNVLEIVMPITNWISKHCTFKGMTSKVTA